MDSLELYRKAVQRLSGRGIGQSPDQPRLTAGQQKLAMNESEFLSLPVDREEWNPLQVLAAGATFGQFYFLADFDDPDSPNHPIR